MFARKAIVLYLTSYLLIMCLRHGWGPGQDCCRRPESNWLVSDGFSVCFANNSIFTGITWRLSSCLVKPCISRVSSVPVKGKLEFCSLGDSLSVSEGARHAAEDAIVHLNHLVDGLRRDIFPEEEGTQARSNKCVFGHGETTPAGVNIYWVF